MQCSALRPPSPTGYTLLRLYPVQANWHILRHTLMRTVPLSLSFAALLVAASCTQPRPAPDQTAVPHSAPGPSIAQSSVPAPAATLLPELPGKRPDGSVLLPNQWSLRPAGK